MASIADLEDSLRQADAAGDTDAATTLADAIRSMRPAAAPANKDYESGRNAPGALRGLLSVMNGPTIGFGDELAGAVGGLYDTASKGGSLSDNYKANRDYARGAQDMERETNPWTTGITQSMAAAPLAGLKLLQGATYAPKIVGSMTNYGRAIGAGATYGGIGGVGNSTDETLEGNLNAAGKGAIFGAAASGALAPIGMGIAAVGSNIAQRITPDGLQKLPFSAQSAAKAQVAEAFARDARGETFTSGASNPAAQALARYNKLGPDAVLADAGGQNVKGKLDLLASLPGRTKQAAETLIHDRQAGRAGRMIGAAESSMGTTGQRLNPSLDAWAAERQATAAPLYEQVRKIDIDPSDDLRAMVTAADNAGALKAARAIANTDQVTFNIDAANPGQWNMRELDHVKKGLDQMIAGQWNDKTGKFTEQGASLIGLKSRLLQELDTVAPVYKQARDAYAGPSEIIDAANLGRASMSKDGAAISRLTGDLSDSEMQAFRLGAFEGLRSKLGKEGGQTEILKMWKEPATREKLTEMFGDELRFRSFAADVAKEARLKGIESVGRGSQTMSRQFAAGDMDAGVAGLEAAANIATSGPIGAMSGASKLWNKISTPQATQDEMGRLLLSKGAQGTSNLESLQDLIQRINSNNATYSNLTGSVIGSQLTPRMPGLLGQ